MDRNQHPHWRTEASACRGQLVDKAAAYILQGALDRLKAATR